MAHLLFESRNLENRNLKSELLAAFISQNKSGIEIKKSWDSLEIRNGE